MAADLEALIAKAFRVRGVHARQAYALARRVAGYPHDRRRRQVMASLPAASFQVPEDQGFLVAPPGTFEETTAIVAHANAKVDAYRPDAPPAGKNRKRFLQNIIDCSALGVESPLMRFALRPDVLAAVAAYLGVPPLLTTISVFLSEPSDPELRSSQLFHCDGDDVRQVKVFVLCRDVDAASGPLTLLDAATSRRVMSAAQYQFRQRLSDEQVHAAVGAGREIPILGPAGTAVFVDTSRCFHYGSRVAAGATPRLVTMVQYQTPYSFMLPARALPFRHLATENLSELQRLALAG